MRRVVLDTCVLVPSRQRDFLLQLAAEGAYTPLRSGGILQELETTLIDVYRQRGASLGKNYLPRLLTAMTLAFADATIDAPRDLVYPYRLDDPNDGHVAHAAIVGRAEVIVTADVRAGFQASEHLADAGVVVMAPKDFVAAVVSSDPDAGVLNALSDRLTSPPASPVEILDILANRYGMGDVRKTLRPLL